LPRRRAAARFKGAYLKTKPATASRFFFIGTPRSRELGSTTNEKTQAVGPGFGFLVDILERRSNTNKVKAISLDFTEARIRSFHVPNLSWWDTGV
jgi:hypothetical protein